MTNFRLRTAGCGVLILAVMKSYPEPVEGYAARRFDKLSERG